MLFKIVDDRKYCERKCKTSDIFKSWGLVFWKLQSCFEVFLRYE